MTSLYQIDALVLWRFIPVPLVFFLFFFRFRKFYSDILKVIFERLFYYLLTQHFETKEKQLPPLCATLAPKILCFCCFLYCWRKHGCACASSFLLPNITFKYQFYRTFDFCHLLNGLYLIVLRYDTRNNRCEIAIQI